MTRDLDQLSGRTFDLLVVGGGIHGLAIAYDAAQRGLGVALIERGDFGGGASFNHLRTIHGGLRYLQTVDVSRSRESVLERRAFARIAPHALRPTPFALPLYRSLMRGKLAMRVGFALDRIVTLGRNRGVPASLRLPAGHVVSRGTAIQLYPGLRRQGLTGAAVWHDYVSTESDRLTFAFVLAAFEHGAVLANHVEATEPLTEGRRVTGVKARDDLTGGCFEIACRLLVNATGGDLDALIEPLNISTRIPMVKAMNLVTKRDAGEEALGGRSLDGRYLFLVPWRERALFGTWESGQVCPPDDRTISEADVASFITDLNQAFPALDLTLSDVTLVHRGVLPATINGSHVGPAKLMQLRDHASDGVDGLVSVASAKYTTARATAEQVTDLVFSKLGRQAVPCRTGTTVLPGGGIRDVGFAIAEGRREHDEGLPSDTIPHLIAAYGSRYRDVLEVAAARPDWRTRIAPDLPVIGAQLIHAVRREMAVTLSDAVLRRTPIGALGDPGEEPLARAAAIVGGELGWPIERQGEEVAAVRRFYGTLKPLNT
jgi:glycerol-3-phosphate dehydrogenase